MPCFDRFLYMAFYNNNANAIIITMLYNASKIVFSNRQGYIQHYFCPYI